MFRRLFILTFLMLVSMVGMAQSKYTDYLQRKVAGRGTVVVHHDAEIDILVNGTASTAAPKDKTVVSQSGTIAGEVAPQEEEAPAVAPSGRHTTANGFRVQIISLGSNARDKAEAESWGRRFKAYFPATNVYISFRSPHYVCRVGDYKTREEANEMLKQLRETHQFGSASIVRSKINIYY